MIRKEKNKPMDLQPSFPTPDWSQDLDGLVRDGCKILELNFAPGTINYQLYGLKVYIIFYNTFVH